MRVRMKVAISGQRFTGEVDKKGNSLAGSPWPARGEECEVSDAEAVDLISAGLAEPADGSSPEHAAPPAPEAAAPPAPEVTEPPAPEQSAK